MDSTFAKTIRDSLAFPRSPAERRRGNVLVLLAILLPTLIGIVGLVIDGGLMMDEHRNLQHATDAAATAAAMDLRLGKSSAVATATATSFIRNANQLPDANVTVHIPPVSGKFAGQTGYVEVNATRIYHPRFMPLLDAISDRTLGTRAVAGYASVTAGAAIAVLDPDPAAFSMAPLPTLPALPTLTAGFEIEGLGSFSVDGAVLVNNGWGGVDENGDAAGSAAGPPNAVACTPVLPLTRLRARDIRVVGGVDDQHNYQNFVAGKSSPLQANRLPVPDPYAALPVPTVSADPNNASAITRGGVTVAGLPLIGPPVTLQPGVYQYIRVVSGIANFQPGVYIIRSTDPVSHMALSIAAGTVNAHGVLFYITDSSGFDGISGSPDGSDGETEPPGPTTTTLQPSVFIQNGLLGTGITALNDPGSPFDGMVIYQRREDRRAIVIAQQNLVGNGAFSGAVYAKWGHVILAGNGIYNARFACGTMRVLTVFNVTLSPSALFPPAKDVLLVE
jgi:Flp pilus assembly protein TadG